MNVEFDGEIFRWDARTDVVMLLTALPDEASADIHEIPRPPRGFGAVRVDVTVGGSQWRTSIFPSSDGPYVLPLKKPVLKAEGLEEGGPVHVRLVVLDA